jgi:hypothetical protein
MGMYEDFNPYEFGEEEEEEEEEEGLEFFGLIKYTTNAAYLIELDQDHKEWFPKSQLSNVSIDEETGSITATCPYWLAERKGLV